MKSYKRAIFLIACVSCAEQNMRTQTENKSNLSFATVDDSCQYTVTIKSKCRIWYSNVLFESRFRYRIDDELELSCDSQHNNPALITG